MNIAIILFIYFSILILFGFITSRNESYEGFLIADRKIGPWRASLSILATWFDGPLLFTFITIGFASFYGTIWICIGVLLGLIFYTIASPKIREISFKNKLYSYPELAFVLFDKKVGLLISILSFFVFQGLLVLVLVVGAQILQELGGISYTVSILLMGLISASYLLLGGFKASVATDIFQILILVILSIMLIFFAQRPEVLTLPSIDSFFVYIKSSIVSSLIFTLALMFSSDGFSRIIATNSNKSARKASYITICLFCIIAFYFSVWGLVISGVYPGLNPELAPIYLFTKMIPSWLYPFALITLFGVLMSSLDTYALVTAQSLLNCKAFKTKKFDVYKKHSKNLLRLAIIIVFAIGILMSFFVQSIVESFFVVVMLLGCGSPMILSIIFKRYNSNIMFISVFLALLIHCIMFFTDTLTELNSATVNISAIILWLILTFIFNRKNIKN